MSKNYSSTKTALLERLLSEKHIAPFKPLMKGQDITKEKPEDIKAMMDNLFEVLNTEISYLMENLSTDSLLILNEYCRRELIDNDKVKADEKIWYEEENSLSNLLICNAKNELKGRANYISRNEKKVIAA